jgi:aromatic ring-opening dioxygenase catalytic subunit (LigB family)
LFFSAHFYYLQGGAVAYKFSSTDAFQSFKSLVQASRQVQPGEQQRQQQQQQLEQEQEIHKQQQQQQQQPRVNNWVPLQAASKEELEKVIKVSAMQLSLTHASSAEAVIKQLSNFCSFH